MSMPPIIIKVPLSVHDREAGKEAGTCAWRKEDRVRKKKQEEEEEEKKN